MLLRGFFVRQVYLVLVYSCKITLEHDCMYKKEYIRWISDKVRWSWIKLNEVRWSNMKLHEVTLDIMIHEMS